MRLSQATNKTQSHSAASPPIVISLYGCQFGYNHPAGRRRELRETALPKVEALRLVISPASTGTSEALALSCMYLRFADDRKRHLPNRDWRDNPEYLVLAWASLGALTSRYLAWKKMFWQHTELAIALHSIQSVIVVALRDCGACKVNFGAAHSGSQEGEQDARGALLLEFGRSVKGRYSNLQSATSLMRPTASLREPVRKQMHLHFWACRVIAYLVISSSIASRVVA